MGLSLDRPVDEVQVATPAPSPTSTSDTSPCTGQEWAASSSSLPLPEGALSAWLCGDGVAWVGPPDALTDGLDALPAITAGLDAASPDVGSQCLDAEASFALVVRYPDGERTLIGSLGGCDALRSGDVWVGSSSTLLSELAQLWNAQRDLKDTDADPDPRCSLASSLLPVDIGEVVGGVACSSGNPVGLDADLVRELARAAAGAAPTASPSAGSASPAEPRLAMVLWSASGDSLPVLADAEGRLYWGEPQISWAPDRALAQRLAPHLPS